MCYIYIFLSRWRRDCNSTSVIRMLDEFDYPAINVNKKKAVVQQGATALIKFS